MSTASQVHEFMYYVGFEGSDFIASLKTMTCVVPLIACSGVRCRGYMSGSAVAAVGVGGFQSRCVHGVCRVKSLGVCCLMSHDYIQDYVVRSPEFVLAYQGP